MSALIQYGCNIYILALHLQACCKCGVFKLWEEVAKAETQQGPPNPYLSGILSKCTVTPHTFCFSTVSSSRCLYTYGLFATILLFFTGASGFMPCHHVCLIHACSCSPIYEYEIVALTSYTRYRILFPVCHACSQSRASAAA